MSVSSEKGSLDSSREEDHAVISDDLKVRRKSITGQFMQVLHRQKSQLSLLCNDSAGGKPFDKIFETAEVLGEGGFAFVYRCTHKKNKNVYAVKEVMKSSYNSPGENLNDEIDALRLLCDGPYVVRLFDVYKEEERTCMVMELMYGGDLLDRLGEKEVYDEKEARRVAVTLIEAISFCHKKRICHRDVKPENILLAKKDDDCMIKLGDFGCAKRITGPNCLHTLCGSPQYVAPELLINENGYDEQCDLWSTGIVIYVLLGGYAPFDAPEEELAELIINGKIEFHEEYWDHIGYGPKDLILSLLQVDPEERCNADEALDCNWLRRRDSQILLQGEEGGAQRRNSFQAWLQRSNSWKQLQLDLDQEDEEEEEAERLKALQL